MKIYKYSGAGNDFFMIDGRNAEVSHYRNPEVISALCDRNSNLPLPQGVRQGSDGVIILSIAPGEDFVMEFFNPDGSSGMMCGNGGRCVVAFAHFLGIEPSHGATYRFSAPDGPHFGEVLSSEGNLASVRLGMKDVEGVTRFDDGVFLDTGARHFVTLVPDVEAVDIDTIGHDIRWQERFAPQGSNVNFLSRSTDGNISVRTFEKGVEAETLACGTGVTASALAAHIFGIPATSLSPDGSIHYDIHTRQAVLGVDFEVSDSHSFRRICLTGPAESQAELEID